MSYIIEVTVPALPAADALRMSQENEAGRHPALVRLHDVLTAVYPCMSRYPDGDPPLGECPWSDGPLIGNVGSRMAVLGLNGGGQLAVATRFVTDAATMLGLTALDQQAGTIYRPDPERRAATYFVTVNGVSRGARKEPVAARLAHAFGRDRCRSAPCSTGPWPSSGPGSTGSAHCNTATRCSNSAATAAWDRKLPGCRF
jgi:hypothetical protein